MTIDEMSAVLQAAKEGKKIQNEDFGADRWREFNLVAFLDGLNIRVAPEPREIWVPEFNGRLFGDHGRTPEDVHEHWGRPEERAKPIRFREVL